MKGELKMYETVFFLSQKGAGVGPLGGAFPYKII